MRHVIALVAIVLVAAAQDTLTISKIAVPFGADPRPFCVSLSEDGRLLAYQSARAGGHGRQDIWLSRFENGRWSEPYNAGPGVNTASQDVDAKLSPDGRTMVFIRGDDFKVSSQIYISHFRNGAWSQAQPVGAPASPPDTVEFGALLSKDGKRLYFSSNRKGGYGGFDHYYSERSGDKWGEPFNLGPTVNTAENEVDMALSPDARTIIYPARKPDSLAGSTDLYLSRFVNNAWTAPENLGPRINTPVTDTCPWLSYDGKTLYVNTEWDGLLGGRKADTTVWMFHHPKGF